MKLTLADPLEYTAILKELYGRLFFKMYGFALKELDAKGGAEDAGINCGVIMINMNTAEYRISRYMEK